MKQVICCLLLLALVCSLFACDWANDYVATKVHVEQTVVPSTEPEEPIPVVTNRNELRGTVLGFIRNWTEQGIMTLQGYQGDIQADLDETMRYATEEDPIGAFAVDYVDAQIFGDGNSGRIEVAIVFRRSAAEIDAIVTVSGNEGAYSRIQQALSTYDTALTLRVRNYQEADFAALINSYCLEHPDRVLTVPQLSAEVYPKVGETRILELHFSYPESRENMRAHQQEVSTILSSASSYISSGESSIEKVILLYRFLCTRFQYEVQGQEPVMPAYDLLCTGLAHSRSFASVFCAQCNSADIECFVVSGTVGGVPHYWNLISIEDTYYYVDLMRSITHGELEIRFLTGEELFAEEYRWNVGDYPVVMVPSSGTTHEDTQENEDTNSSGEDEQP